MNRCFTPISFWSKYFFIFFTLILAGSALSAQNTVSGRVVDSANAGISRVSVSVRGTQRGTVTDAGGNFRVSASPGEVLVISYLGYVTQEIPVRGSRAVNVTLSPDARQLSDVVVVGYGQKNRKLLTESISTVGSKELQRLPVASADAAMQGRVSGVQITNVDGSPGSPVAVRVRGVGTVGNTQPLFVIDGIPVGNNGGVNTNPLSTLNPSDIENISVLKDASSAAIYGMRAANGVVLITTKRGKTGRPRVTLDAYYGIQQFRRRLQVNNTQQYVALAEEALNNRNKQDSLFPGDEGYRVLHRDLIADSANNVLGINTDWQEATINKNAPVANYNLGVSGGTENANYFFSLGYFNQEAITKRWDLQRYTVRANSDYKIGSRLKIGQTLALSFQEVKRGMNGGGDGYLYANNLSMPPFFKIYDDENKIPGNRYGYNGNANVAGFTIGNQLALNEIVVNTDHNYRLLGGIYGELELIKGLKYRSAASVDFSFGRDTRWQPGYTAAEIGFGREANNYSDNRSQGYTQVFTNTLTFDRSVGEHSFNVLAGVEYQKIRGNNLSYNGTNFQSTDPSFYQNVANGRGSNGQFANAGASLYNEAYASYFGRLSYNYREKYLLTATFRNDGTSRFAPENRFGKFPSVSAAWRVSEESFFQNLPVISSLKLRGSWGQLGNSNTSSFPYIARVSFTPQYPLNGVPSQAPIPPSLPNPRIGWETVKSFDFGFDASFFNNKASLLATYYRRNTTNFLYTLPVPFTSGFGGSDVNVGNVQNTGVELEVTYNTRIARKVNFNIGGNLTTVKNRLVALAQGVEEYTTGGAYRTAVGYPIGYFYGYRMLGIYQDEAQAAGAVPDNVAGANTPRPGDAIFEDNNGPLEGSPNGKQFSGKPDSLITPEDRTYLGKTIPDFYYGINLDANYNGFDLSVLFQGVSGIQVYNQLRQNLEGLGGPGRNQLATTANRWKGPGTSNTMPRAIDGDPYQNNRISNRFIENAGFLRFKNIQIGYSLPQELLSKTKAFRSARIYIGATNLFTITKYTGLDPEVITFGNVTTQTESGTDLGSTPQPRTFQVGLQVSF
ncbi:MAG TPA: TonB-dependent receptor [Segetibacter sp.]|nr:TonB-dependent receptor [Segetibacter sp.]